MERVAARTAIAGIVTEAEASFDEHTLWPAHPSDGDVPPAEALTLYLGASGVDRLTPPSRGVTIDSVKKARAGAEVTRSLAWRAR